MYLDSLIATGEGSNGKQVHIAEGLQKRYLALVTYLLGDGLDFLVEEIRRAVEGKEKKRNNKISEMIYFNFRCKLTRGVRILGHIYIKGRFNNYFPGRCK